MSTHQAYPIDIIATDGHEQKIKNTTETYESHINDAKNYADVVRI